MKLTSKSLQRNFYYNDGIFKTIGFENKLNNTRFKVFNSSEFIIYLIDGNLINSNEMKAMIIEENNNTIKVKFKGFDLDVYLNYEIKEDIIYKNILLTKFDKRINYIDCENFEFQDNNNLYETIKQKNNDQMGNMDGFYFECGQPVYAKSMFLGMEFPIAENRLENKKYFSRYYYGKVIKDSLSIPSLITGASRYFDFDNIKKDFFKYIKKISLPIRLRKQYSSWYDHMLDITEEKLIDSFEKIHDNFLKYNIKLDSYVIDDGWANYKSVWDFNKKFSNGLDNVAKKVKSLDSSLGLWIGPRGGYNGTEVIMSDWLEENSHLNIGSKNKKTNDVNVGDLNYLNYMKKRMLYYQNKYDLMAWKIDGLIKRPSEDDESGNFGMHTMTEVYEFLIDLFIDLRKSSKDKNYHLNLTSYVNLSPWWLKWVNSVWIQFSKDIGFTENAGNDFERLLTYRDSQYYEFIKERKLSFPLYGIFNHEPIYGESSHKWNLDHKIYASIEQFKEFLLFISTRGNSLWEFYYSYTMFDEERWKANGEVVNWISNNYYILKNSQLFGEKASRMNGIYGYKCISDDEKEMIVSFRNPGNKKYSLEFYLENKFNEINIISGKKSFLKKVKIKIN